MLNKLEFEVQKYGKDVIYFVDVHKELHRKLKNNLFLVVFTFFTIILIIALAIGINNFAPDHYSDNTQIFINSLLYSIIGLGIILINTLLLIFIKLLHPKEFSKEVIDASSPASIMDMDRYKDLVQKVTKINHEMDKRMKLILPFISFLYFISFIFLFVSYLLIIESFLIYFGTLPENIKDLMSYLNLFK